MASAVILHVGMHKTGTSSIQRALIGYEDSDYRYADLGRPNHSVPLHSAFSSRPHDLLCREGLAPDDIAAYGERCRGMLARELAGPRKVILSGEDLCDLSAGETLELYRFLRRHTDHITVIGFCRSPLSFASASLQQRVKAGFGDFRLYQPNYRQRLEKYLEIFGREHCHFRDYDPRSFPQGSVVQALRDWLGLDPSRIVEHRTNTGMSWEALRTIAAFNRAMPELGGAKGFWPYRLAFVGWLMEKLPGGKFELPDAYLPLLDRDDSRWLRDAVGIDYLGDLEAWPAAADTRAGRERFETAYFTLPEQSLDQLRQLLAALGTRPEPAEDATLLTRRLFLGFLGDMLIRHDEVDAWVRIAQATAEQQVPGTEDVLSLLECAGRLRPEGPRIKTLKRQLS